MGASIATNISDQISTVDTNIQSTTTINENASNDNTQSTLLDNVTFESGADISIQNSAELINSVQQIGSNSNSASLSNDVALSLAQSATASVSSYGIGLSDSYNSAFTMSTITNSVTSVAETNMSEVNANSQDITITNSTFDTAGEITIGNIVSSLLDGTQTGSVDTLTDVANTVSETTDQSATSTVSGISFGILIIIVAIVLVVIVLKIFMKKKSSAKGGHLSKKLIGGFSIQDGYDTVSGLVIASLLIIFGVVNILNRAPCNNNVQCDSSIWYNPNVGGCSCTDHMTCGLTEPYKTPISDIGVPIMWISPMESTGGILDDSIYLRRMAVRSICGWDASQSKANNSGYNVYNYVQIYKLVTQSASAPTTEIHQIYVALYEFMKNHLSVEGANKDNDSNITVIYDPNYSGSASDYVAPCTQSIVQSLLPIVPYYAPETIVDSSCVVTATGTGSLNASCSNSTTSTLQKNFKNITMLADTILKKPKATKNANFTQKKEPSKMKKIKLMKKTQQRKFNFFDNVKKAFKKIRLTDTASSSYQITGGVNIAQRLCYNTSTLLFKRRPYDQSCSSAYGGDVGGDWKEMWTPNNLNTYKLCSSTSAAGGTDTYNADSNSTSVKVTGYDTGCSSYYRYLLPGNNDCSSIGSMWTEKTSSVKLYPTCDDTSSYFILPANFESASFGGSDQNTDGPYNMYLGGNWWPEDSGADDLRNSHSSGGWQYSSTSYNHSDYNLAYASGVNEARAALISDLSSAANSGNNLSVASILGSDTTTGVTEGLNSQYNSMTFDTDNIALIRFGVATTAGDNRIGTALQSFGTGTNADTNTRFIAELPSSYGDPSITTDDIVANAATTAYTECGVSLADSYLRAAFGFGTIPSPFTGMNQITSTGNYKYLSATDTFADFYMNFVTNPSAYFNLSSGGVASAINYLPMLNNSGMINPIGNAILKYQSDDINVALCDSSEGLGNCWNPVLCQANGGIWVDENDIAICSNATDVNFDSTNFTDCYPGKCSLTDSLCSITNCTECTTEDMCPTDDDYCIWDPIQGCTLGCKPDAQQCSQCTTESNCTSPCAWLDDRQMCVYGSAQCDSDSENRVCCFDETNYLIKIPSAFTSTGNTVDSVDATCTPGVFTVDLSTGASAYDATITGSSTSSDATTDTTTDDADSASSTTSSTTSSASAIACGENASTYFTTSFSIDCRLDNSNCYGSTNELNNCAPSSCGTNNFHFVKIPGTAECFYDTDQSYHYNTSGCSPTLLLAAENAQQWEYADANFNNDNGTSMYYSINRIFSWVLMLSQSAESRSYITSQLGLSTLLNSQGMNTDTNAPYLPLESVDDIASHLSSTSNEWSHIQPLLFVDDDGGYHFATLEDIQNKINENSNVDYMDWWKDSYITQINQFVYNSTDNTSSFPSSVLSFAKTGLGDLSSDLTTVLNEMQLFQGDLVGSTGYCKTLMQEMAIGSLGVAAVLIVILIAMFVMKLKKEQ